jgi:aquaporin Z
MKNQPSHLTEYAIEGALLGAFMVSACAFTILLQHPALPLRALLPDAFARRALIGIAMGLTAIALIYSPLGRRSGAHMNPAVTITFLHLGKIARRDAAAYIVAQFIGGPIGVLLVRLAAGMLVADPTVHYAVTEPGPYGRTVALAAEIAISFLTMSVVLRTSNRTAWAPYTGLIVGLLVASYVTFEAPLSGFSQNPARTFASALLAHDFTAIWIYFLAPLLGMIAAAEFYRRTSGLHRVFCAKLNHGAGARCIFHCNFGQIGEAA